MKNKASNVSSKLPRAAQLQTTREKKCGNCNVAGAELDADWVWLWVSRLTAPPARSVPAWVRSQPGSSSTYCGVYTAYPYLIVGVLQT